MHCLLNVLLEKLLAYSNEATEKEELLRLQYWVNPHFNENA